MRIFHIQGDQFTELNVLPEAAPGAGYYWVGTTRDEFEANIQSLQSALQRWTGGQLVDLHLADLLNKQLPSHFDYTSWYDLLVFRRLTAGPSADAASANPICDMPLAVCMWTTVFPNTAATSGSNVVEPVGRPRERVDVIPIRVGICVQKNDA